jgi:basic membrane lipoprotein Med (substrate-binding protein (PBP1-ABC) superfamily)
MSKRPCSRFAAVRGSVAFPGRLMLVAIAAAVTVGAVAGCGSTSSSSTTAAITKAAFLAKANAICIQSNKRTNTAGAKLGKNPTQAQIVTTVRTKFVPSIQTSITQIRALGAPTGDQATVTKILNLAQADLNKVKSNPLLLVGSNAAFADFAKIAHPYGLKECAATS